MHIITGMHRSGTSLVARLFCDAGADMGNKDDFYRPDKWNPDGYYEQPEIHAVNMPLINGPWGKLSYFLLPTETTIMRRAGRRSNQIRRTAETYRGRVVKETRFCLTLPAWRAHGAQIDNILVCLRDPAAVAHSLKRRNHISQRHAYRLWLAHNRRLLQSTADIPLWFVYYANLMDGKRFAGEFGPALRFFGVEASPSRLESMHANAVKPQMDHWTPAETSYPADVETLWRELTGRHAAQFESQ